MIDIPDKPILLLDEKRCRNNIKRMADKAKAAGCEFRPHFKTHQSATIGEWFREHEIKGITVSSISMAEYFCNNGWDDITIAFPFYLSQINALKVLNQKCSLRLFVNSVRDVKLLSENLSNDFRVYIELDTGYTRSGIPQNNNDLITSIINACSEISHVHFHGFYVHHGGTYQAKGIEEIKRIIAPTLSVYQEMRQVFPDAKFSLGDTPSASVLSDFDNVDELSPGNFVFYDWMQTQIGSCTLNDVALFVLLPIAQVLKVQNQAILHGGAVHLSKDFIENECGRNYGQVVRYTRENVISEPAYITSLSQEHGILNATPDNKQDYVIICPVHSCLTANLHSFYLTADGKKIEKKVLS